MFCISLSSCVQQDISDFRIEYSMDLEIAPDGNLIATKVYTQLFESEWIKFLIRNNINDDQIDRVMPMEIRLEPILSNPISYGFISKAEATVYTLQAPGARIHIGEKYPDLGVSRGDLYLFPGLANIHPILQNGQFVLELALNYRTSPGSFFDNRLIVKLDVFLK